MKITGVETFIIDGAWRNWVIVKVSTDECIDGIGEASIEGKELSSAAAVIEMKDFLIGEDPFNVEKLWQKMYRFSFWTGGPIVCTAISGIEQALWDIIGKKLNVPVYKLMGGLVNEKIKVYASGWCLGAKTPEELLEKARDVIEKGYNAIKLDPFDFCYQFLDSKQLDEVEEKIRVLRNGVGNDIELMMDLHGRFSLSTAAQILERLNKYNFLFFEEPIPFDNPDSYIALSRKTSAPLACGERLFTRYGFWEIIRNKIVNIVQPDVCHAGGILECKKISAMAEANYIGLTPHNPNGPVGMAATLHWIATTPNLLMLETDVNDVPWRKEIFSGLPEIKNGIIEVSDRPGLGIEFDEKKAAEHPHKHYPFDIYEKTDKTFEWKTKQK